MEPARWSPSALQIRVLPPATPFSGASPLLCSRRSRSSPARGSFWPRLGPRLRPPHAGCTAPARPRSDRLSARRRVVCSPGTARPSSQERECRCCRWYWWAPPLPLPAFPVLVVASAPAAAAAAACDSPPPLSFFSFSLRPLSPGVRARGWHGWLWPELARVCACVSVRVWRALEPCSLSGSRRRHRTEEAAAARRPGPRDEAPTCSQLPGPAGELISHPPGSGFRGPRDAALGCPAPAPPARPLCAPGKEFVWPSLQLSAQVAGSRGDPRRGENLGRRRRRVWRRRSHPWPSRLPLPFPSLPLSAGKGRTRKKKKKKGGGVGELDIKIGWGDGGTFLVSPAASFLKRQRQREEKQPQL